jgi:Ser/Thr protein kinase RdoA (MazF antagonist)
LLRNRVSSIRAITLDQLRPFLADLGVAAPVALVELSGGSNAAFRVELADGSALILKTYDDVRGKLPTSEAYASDLLADTGLPVTRYLALDETRRRLPFRFAITNHLPGVTVGSLRGAPDIGDAYRQMGTALRQLHAVRLPAYGRFGANGLDTPVAANIDVVRARAAHGLARFRHFGAPEALAARIETTLDRHARLATWSAGAVFAHDDFHPNNVLVLRDGSGRLRLSGIIDFGDAFAGDAVSDLAKTLFCCEHDAPGSTPAILQGYGPVEHPNPALALWFYTMLHRVTMWWWLRQVGVIGEGEAHPLLADLEAMGDEPPTGAVVA